MGHLRTGTLPKSNTWKSVVSSIDAFAEGGIGESNISDIANKTLDASSQTLRELPSDQSIQNCFRFLVALAVAGRSRDIKSSLQTFGIIIEEYPSKLQLSKALRKWLKSLSVKEYNPEFESLARKATVDTIAGWLNKYLSKAQQDMFFQEEDPFQPWREASDGRGFCELSRMFFSNFTSRYLKYFLSRTASSQLQTVTDREHFEVSINYSIDKISQHAFETSKIVQSFSAGWFNKYAIDGIPSAKKIEAFLHLSFEKIREELRREKRAD